MSDTVRGESAGGVLTRRMGVLLLTTLINFIGVGIIGPIAPALAAEYGADALLIGLLYTSYSLAQFVGVPALGALSDRFGRRPILLISLLGSALGYAIFGIGGALWVLFAGRVLEGVTNGNISTVFAYTADITSKEQRTRSFGYLSAAMGVGLIVGPVLGGLLSRVSIAAPMYLIAVLTLLNAALAYRLLPESLPAERRAGALGLRQINPVAQLRYVLGLAQLRRLVLGSLLLTVAMAVLLSNLPVLMAGRFGWDAEGIATLYSLYGVVAVLAQVVVLPRLLPRLGEPRLALLGFGISALGYAAIVASDALGATLFVFLSAMLIGLGNPLVATSLGGLISKRAGGHEQGRVQGGNLAVQTLGNIAGPMWGGWLFVALGSGAPYWVNVLTLLAGAAIVLPLALRRPPEASSVEPTAAPTTSHL
jgi:MFS transporter, DHA1 family, tetracycline resistance protein